MCVCDSESPFRKQGEWKWYESCQQWSSFLLHCKYSWYHIMLAKIPNTVPRQGCFRAAGIHVFHRAFFIVGYTPRTETVLDDATMHKPTNPATFCLSERIANIHKIFNFHVPSSFLVTFCQVMYRFGQVLENTTTKTT